MESYLIQSLLTVLSPHNLFLILLGTIYGILCGALPGVSSSMAIVLVLPFTYVMEPVTAIITLVSVYIGGACGGSISAILLKIPGTPEAVATTFDGYPMALKGEAGKALGIAVTASSFGGIFSAFVMVISAPLLAKFALNFQSAEYFALALLGLSCITSIGSKNQLKAVLSAIFGLMCATIGIDSISGLERFTFSQPFLTNGINYIPVMIGTFAIAEVYKNIEQVDQGNSIIIPESGISFELMRIKEMAKMWVTFVKSAVIGTIIGIIPAAGGSIASLVSYGEAVRSSKNPNAFGTGVPEGIVAAEAANNAAVGGSMVPTLVLGIPGSPTAAVILAVFMILGLRPGPLILKSQPVLLYSLFYSIILTSFLLFLVGRYITREFAHISKLPYPILGTIIITLCIIGAYSLNNSYYDVIIMFIFSFIGYFFDKYKYSSAAFILGLILGGMVEDSLRKQIIINNGSILGIFTRPLSAIILVIALLTFIKPVINNIKNKYTT